MNEVVPLFLGAALALICGAVRGRRARAMTWVALSVVLGVGATVLTGEASVSWEFVLIDVPLVAASALGTRALLRTMAHRRPDGALGRYAHPDQAG
jgi:hypothetical protein